MKRRLTQQERQERARESLGRATQGVTMSNFPAIFEGFTVRGIPEDDIRPRENVFTFEAWKALGRHVRKGEHGVKVVTWITRGGTEDPETGEVKGGYRFSRTTTVFHVSQTEPDIAPDSANLTPCEVTA